MVLNFTAFIKAKNTQYLISPAFSSRCEICNSFPKLYNSFPHLLAYEIHSQLNKDQNGKNHTDQQNQHKAGSKSNHKIKEDNPFDPNEKKHTPKEEVPYKESPDEITMDVTDGQG
jgi:hypothetical protein